MQQMLHVGTVITFNVLFPQNVLWRPSRRGGGSLRRLLPSTLSHGVACLAILSLRGLLTHTALPLPMPLPLRLALVPLPVPAQASLYRIRCGVVRISDSALLRSTPRPDTGTQPTTQRLEWPTREYLARIPAAQNHRESLKGPRKLNKSNSMAYYANHLLLLF